LYAVTGHQLDSSGKLAMEAILETQAETILQFLHGLRGSLHVAFEEVVVCDPRKNALLKAGNKNDRIDARKLAELLYMNKLNPVYHGEHGIRTCGREELNTMNLWAGVDGPA
jgi:hypothetical protein